MAEGMEGGRRAAPEQPRKKTVTVEVLGCRDLRSRYGQNIMPWVFYEFYTFDQHFSATA